MLIISIILVILLILSIIVLIQYNILMKLKKKVDHAKADLDVYCQQRYDLIPSLVNVVNAYTAHEKSILEELGKSRVQYITTKDVTVGEKIDKNLEILMNNIEAYPDLKANEQFINLQKALEKVETQLQAARKIYNDDVMKYNTKMYVIPFSWIAEAFEFEEAKYFEREK